jgi:hypothetical protein
MKIGTGIHPRNWHWGAWVLLVVLAAVVLLLTHRPSGGTAFAAELQQTAPTDSTTIPDDSDLAPPPDDTTAPPPEASTEPPASVKAATGDGNGYVAEIVDSSYTVGPAEFFALDLPTKAPGAHATHLFGTVTTAGKKDIMVRLFKSSDYDRWLKIKSGRKPLAFYTSPRSHSLTLDQDLPPEPVVLLLDNGYSIRTSKKVTCQLQLRYQRGDAMDEGGNPIASPSVAPKPAPSDDNLPTPRANTDNEMPPPPPPPPSGD